MAAAIRAIGRGRQINQPFVHGQTLDVLLRALK